ncbi:DUF2399 domain-containing protein [Candidatus Protofrankia californiensis]|uniref:DUF2399 domain-containing protein n=1 Tax=Candidatus Protofrankia californiensis TaxID=1839754 RepID=UPI001041B9B8|nr:DUF2399 domain-containing protein [Candidatus Protofrankia californiensis]
MTATPPDARPHPRIDSPHGDAPRKEIPREEAPREDTLAWLRQPALGRLWDAAHRRLEANGARAQGTLRLSDVTPDERQAITQMLGTPVSVRDGVARVRLDQLDERLRSSAAARGVVAVLTVLGRPVADRVGQRRANRDAWSEVWASARAALAAACLADVPWASAWLETTRRTSGLARFGPDGAAVLLDHAVETLAVLRAGPDGRDGSGGSARPAAPAGPAGPAGPARPAGPAGPAGSPLRQPSLRQVWIGRGELAESVTGTAHGLDDGAVLARLVLRGLALAADEDPATAVRDAAGRRALWRSAGVVVDEVSSTVLTYGLRPTAEGWRERALRERAAHAQETHLALREVMDTDWTVVPGSLVRVCENPRVVEAAAAREVPVAVVCAAGNPSTVVLELLTRVRNGGARLAYHGDFDWAGIGLANRMITRFDADPWRMTADDYERAVESCRRRRTPALSLTGTPVEAVWDGELAPTMTTLDVTIHEESVLETLLSDLAQPPA